MTTMTTTRLFTPEASSTLLKQFPRVESHDPDERRIKLTIAGYDQFKAGRDGNWNAIVTDQPTGRVFHVRDADCGLGCHCAAKIVRELTNVPRDRWPTLQ